MLILFICFILIDLHIYFSVASPTTSSHNFRYSVCTSPITDDEDYENINGKIDSNSLYFAKKYTAEELEIAEHLIGLNDNLDHETTLSAIYESSEDPEATLSDIEFNDSEKQFDESKRAHLCTNTNENSKSENLKKLLAIQYTQKSQLKKKYDRLLNENTQRNEKVENLFEKDQVIKLGRDTMRGIGWSNKTIQKGLQHWFACRSAGYDFLLKTGLPLPPRRKLRDRINHIKFFPEF